MATDTATTITTHNPVITLVNVFTVEPDHQAELVDILEHATEDVMSKLAGFVSANIHRALDGTKVVNYAQWATKRDYEEMLKNPTVHPHFEQVVKIAKAEPELYEVASVFHD